MTRKLAPSIFLQLDVVKDQNEFLFGSGEDGYVYQMESGLTDDGDAITAQWVTPWLDMGMPETYKEFHSVHIGIESLVSPLTVTWSVDHGADTDTFPAQMHRLPGYTWGSGTWGAPGTWGPGGDIQKKRMILTFPQEAHGQALQLTFSQTASDGGFKITSFSVLFKIMQQYEPVGDM